MRKYCDDEYHCYLGFSLGNGHLWGPGKGLQMVSGMPRARSRGMVVVYQRTNSSSSEARRLDPQDPGLGSLRMLNESIEPMLYLEGEAYGESFGYSLVVLDLNGDGRDDVVVGAPYFQDNGSDADVGAVYGFLSSENWVNEQWTLTHSCKYQQWHQNDHKILTNQYSGRVPWPLAHSPISFS